MRNVSIIFKMHSLGSFEVFRIYLMSEYISTMFQGLYIQVGTESCSSPKEQNAARRALNYVQLPKLWS